MLPIFGINTLLWPAKHLVQKLCILHIILFVWKMSLNGRLETEIKIKQTSRRVKFENPQRSVHIVYHPTPGYFLAHQKACCERRFRHMSHHFLLFFSPRMSWWKAAILLFTLEYVLLSRLLLNSAMARSSIRICCVFVFFLSHSHPLCFLPHLVIFPQRKCVSLLFDVRGMDKAICNIYMRVF